MRKLHCADAAPEAVWTGWATALPLPQMDKQMDKLAARRSMAERPAPRPAPSGQQVVVGRAAAAAVGVALPLQSAALWIRVIPKHGAELAEAGGDLRVGHEHAPQALPQLGIFVGSDVLPAVLGAVLGVPTADVAGLCVCVGGWG